MIRLLKSLLDTVLPQDQDDVSFQESVLHSLMKHDITKDEALSLFTELCIISSKQGDMAMFSDIGNLASLLYRWTDS